MKARVIRNGSHQGELFVEVKFLFDGSHDSVLNYALPVNAEVPLGSILNVTIEVAETPREVLEEAPRDVTPVSAPPLVVPNSPIALPPETGELADSSPSGQAQVSDEKEAATNKEIADESKKGKVK